GPYCLVAIHHAKPGQADAYEQRMLAALEMTRAEPGSLQFHIHRDRANRNRFVIYEAWKDISSLRDHIQKPHFQQFLAEVAEYVDKNIETDWLVMASPYSRGK